MKYDCEYTSVNLVYINGIFLHDSHAKNTFYQVS